jgi:uncharacterized phage protein (TIGR02216 family)
MSPPKTFPPEPFPWEDAMALGLGVLRWNPTEFWRATPRELIAAWHALTGKQSLSPAGRSDLDRLMAAFPDG